MTSMRQTTENQKGFSLVEVLLVVGIFAVIAMGAVQILTDWSRTMINRATGEYLKIVHDSGQNYVRANFIALLNDINSSGDSTVIEIPIAQEGTNPYFLKDGSTFLPSDAGDTTPLRQNVRVLVRKLDTTTDKTTLEVITITQDRLVADNRLRDIAIAGGPDAGYVSAVDPTGGGDTIMLSAYGKWVLDYDDFSSYFTPAPAQGAGGYSVIYSRVQDTDVFQQDVLYRIAIPGSPQYNRMETDLNMNGFGVVGVDTLTADFASVAGAANINGTMSVEDTITLTGTPLSIGQDMVVRGEASTAESDLKVNGNLTLSSTTADEGRILADEALVSGTATAQNADFGQARVLGTATLMAASADGFYVAQQSGANTEMAINKLQISDINESIDIEAKGLFAARAIGSMDATAVDIQDNFFTRGSGNVLDGRTDVGEISIGTLVSCNRSGTDCKP